MLKAQPDVLEALRAQRLTKVVRRSIHLMPSGAGLCRVVVLPEKMAEHPAPARITTE